MVASHSRRTYPMTAKSSKDLTLEDDPVSGGGKVVDELMENHKKGEGHFYSIIDDTEKTVFNALLQHAVKILDAEAGTIALLEGRGPGARDLVFLYTCGQAARKTKHLRIQKDVGCIGWVMTHEKPIRVNNVENDPRFFRKIDQLTGFTTRSVACAPILSEDRLIGVIELINKKTGWFHADDLKLLHTFGDLVGLGMKNLLRDRFQQAQMMESVGELSSGISHNFRNILAGIIVNAQLIQSQFGRNQKLANTAERIIYLAETGSELVNGLLKFSRNGLKGKQEELNLVTLLEETYQIILTTFEKKIKIYTKWPERLYVAGNYDELRQVLMNIYTNARDAMPNGGRLKITAKITVNHIQVRISDSGIGMDAKTAKKIFDPFFTTKEPGEGTGLGLSTSYGIILDHEGDIQVESKPGSGTAFTITLPKSTD